MVRHDVDRLISRTRPIEAGPASGVAPAIAPRTLVAGFLVGLLAAAGGAIYTVYARYGIERGLASSDLTFLRFAVAGIITLPVLVWHWRRDAALLISRWRQWLAVSLLAGPLFGLLMFSAFELAPASHAAVFPFSAISIAGTLMSAYFLGDRITVRKVLGIAIVLVGLLLLSGFSLASMSTSALAGDALFVAAGALWAGFGVVLRKYRIDPLLATAVISLFALLTYVPAYLWMTGARRLFDASFELLLIEALVQGVISGAGSLFAYGLMVSMLGAARAAIFPALAPGLAALMAWPVLGHVPDATETGGLALAMAGLLIAVTRSRR